MTAGDVRSVAEGVPRQGNDPPPQVVVEAADRMECVGGYPKESDADTIPRGLEDFGRGKPWAVAHGGLAIGFAASRFLKASSRGRYQQSQFAPQRRSLASSYGEPAVPAAGETQAGAAL